MQWSRPPQHPIPSNLVCPTSAYSSLPFGCTNWNKACYNAGGFSHCAAKAEVCDVAGSGLGKVCASGQTYDDAAGACITPMRGARQWSSLPNDGAWQAGWRPWDR